MPSANERIPNTALSGEELKIIILRDITKMLSAEGLLSDHMGFGRVSYEVDIRLHLANPYNPESKSTIASRPIAHNIVATEPALAAMESFPLADAPPDSIPLVKRLIRRITSPNAERLREGLMVPMEVRSQDGTTQIMKVKYPPQPDLGDGDITMEDIVPAPDAI